MRTEFWTLFFEGMLGPLILELVKIAAWHDKRKTAARYSDPTYWIGTGALFFLAGFVVAITNLGHPVSLLQATQLGINAPAIACGWASAQSARANQPKAEKAGFIGLIAKPAPGGSFDRLAQVLAW